jgi:hypothetical protein
MRPGEGLGYPLNPPPRVHADRLVAALKHPARRVLPFEAQLQSVTPARVALVGRQLLFATDDN